MQALYTMTFEEFLTRFENSSEWAQVLELFEQFPTYKEEREGVPEITIYTLFKDRYKFREIGAETPSLFAHFCEERVRELYVKYSWKLQLYNEQYNKLMGRSTTLEGGGEDSIYLFPVNSSAQRIASKTSFTRTNAGQIGGNLSNPELLTLALNLRDLYIDVINEFEPLFMGIM